MLSAASIIVLVIACVVALLAIGVLLFYLARPVWRALAAVCRHCWRLVAGEVTDIARILASLLVLPIFALLALGSLIFTRKDAATKFARAMRGEFLRLGVSTYRIFVGHPAKFLGLGAALEGLETRLPGTITSAFGDVLPQRTAMFPGYTILATLPSGGSGARLYRAMPDKRKLKELSRDGFHGGEVVIKSFSTFDDESLPAIVRESRAMEAGRRLGVILDHAISPERFWYVMRFVPGENLRIGAAKWHAMSGPDGLNDANLRRALLVMRDLLTTLRTYHDAGLWHKDVKPDNIILEAIAQRASGDKDASSDATLASELEQLKRGAEEPETRAVLVDFGLVSSLRSGMTLTTHGTEYYRDPEMVRLALKGVRVGEVDGAKFDIYSAGAVLYTMVEDVFPAQGGLSPIRKRCPEAVVWIIRRAMADYAQRYESAHAMLEDVEAAISKLADGARPVDLPSVVGRAETGARDADATGGSGRDEVGAGVREQQSDVARMGGSNKKIPPSAAAASQTTHASSNGNAADSAARPFMDDALPARVGVSSVGVTSMDVSSVGSLDGPRRLIPSVTITNWWTGQFDVSWAREGEQA